MNTIAIRRLRWLCSLLLVTPFEHLLKLVLIPIQQLSTQFFSNSEGKTGEGPQSK